MQSVDKVLLSVVSLLAEPNDESPANVDAAVSEHVGRGVGVSVIQKKTLIHCLT